MYESGYCSAPMNMDMSDGGVSEECDDQVGDRSFNKTSCNAAKGCKWFSGDTDLPGMGGMGEDSTTAVSNCLARQGFANLSMVGGSGAGGMGSDKADNAGTGGSGFGDVCTGSDADCQCHDTSTECSNGLDEDGEPKCSWKTFTDIAGAQPQCMKFNKCDQPTEAKCQAQAGCAYFKDFDAFSGGVVGHCRNFDKFVEVSGANYTCVAFVESSDGGYGYGSTTRSTTKTTTTTTTTTTTSTSPQPTTTTSTKTTVTSKKDEVIDKDGNAQNKDDFTRPPTQPTQPKAGSTARPTVATVSYFDSVGFVIDLEFQENRFDTLVELARLDLDVKANSIVQARMAQLGIDKYYLRDVQAFAEGKDEPNAFDYLTLSVRIRFDDDAAMTTDDATKLIRNLKDQPLKFVLFKGCDKEYKQTNVVLAKKVEHPFWQPSAGQSACGQTDDDEPAEQKTEAEEIAEVAEFIAKNKADAERNQEESGNKMMEQVVVAPAVKAKIDEAWDDLADLQMARAELQTIIAGENVTEAEKASAEARLATKDVEIEAQKSFIKKLRNGDGDGDGASAGAPPPPPPAGNAGSSDDSTDVTPIIIAVVVVVFCAAMAGAIVVFVCKHRMYDEVYGTAGSRGVYGGPAVYGNPVYAAQPGTVPPQGFMSTAASQDYKAQYSAGPPPAAAKKGGGLVRQESMC